MCAYLECMYSPACVRACVLPLQACCFLAGMMERILGSCHDGAHIGPCDDLRANVSWCTRLCLFSIIVIGVCCLTVYVCW